MKTIKTLLLSIVFLSLSVLVFIYMAKLISMINLLYTEVGSNEVTNFSIIFFMNACGAVFVALYLLTLSISYFRDFREYYQKYLDTKVDRDIHKSLQEFKYKELYKELQDCETVELKEARLRTFYQDRHNSMGKYRTRVKLNDILTEEDYDKIKKGIIDACK